MTQCFLILVTPQCDIDVHVHVHVHLYIRSFNKIMVHDSISYFPFEKCLPWVCCVALPCCLFDLACFFLPSASLIKMYTYIVHAY